MRLTLTDPAPRGKRLREMEIVTSLKEQPVPLGAASTVAVLREIVNATLLAKPTKTLAMRAVDWELVLALGTTKACFVGNATTLHRLPLLHRL